MTDGPSSSRSATPGSWVIPQSTIAPARPSRPGASLISTMIASASNSGQHDTSASVLESNVWRHCGVSVFIILCNIKAAPWTLDYCGSSSDALYH